MQELNELISEQLALFIFGFLIIILWLLIWNFIQGSKLRKMRKKYELMMQGTGIDNLEALLVDLKVTQEKIEDVQDDQQQQLRNLQKLMPKQKAKIGIKRYNAFNETGNDLSFSIAFINDEQDGVVITGLYNRDGSFVYAKSISKGDSAHALSPEEREAIALASLGE